MPASPISERIRKNRIEALKAIQIAAGYSFNATVESLSPFGGNEPKEGLIVVVQMDTNPETQYGGTSSAGFNRWRWRASFVANVYIGNDISKNDTRDHDEILNAAAADVMKVLMADYNCVVDGVALAEDTVIEGWTPFGMESNDAQQYTGIVFQFSVSYVAREQDAARND